jgi:hypothetical protein
MKPLIKQLLRENLIEKFEHSIVKETEKAVLVKFKVYKNKEGKEEFIETWIPKSIIDNPIKFNEFIEKAVAEKNKNLESWMKTKGYGHLRNGRGYSLNKPKEKEKVKTLTVHLSPESFPYNSDIFYGYLAQRGDDIKVLDENYKEVMIINNINDLYKYSLEHPQYNLFYLDDKRGNKTFYVQDTNYETIKEKLGNPVDIDQNQFIELDKIKFKKTYSYYFKEDIQEINWKGLAAGAAMTLGTLGAQGQTTEPTKQTPTTQTTQQKPMFGTPEQRAAAKAKREAQRKKNFDISVNNAYGMGFVEDIEEEEFNTGCNIANNQELKYLDGSSPEFPNIVYREMEDGTKVKINMKKYLNYIRKQNKQADVPLDGLQGPNFKSTKCGVSKDAAKQSKSDWGKK